LNYTRNSLASVSITFTALSTAYISYHNKRDLSSVFLNFFQKNSHFFCLIFLLKQMLKISKCKASK